MRRPKVLWKLLIGQVVLLTAVLITATWLIADQAESAQRAEASLLLRRTAKRIGVLVEPGLHSGGATGMDQAVGPFLAGSDGRRVSILTPDGRVLFDSLEGAPDQFEASGETGELLERIRRKGWADVEDWSDAMLQQVRRCAIRVGTDDAPSGIVVLTVPAAPYRERISGTRQRIWSIAATVWIASCLLALVLARFWSGRIGRLTHAAESIVRGDLSTKATVSGRDETASLADSLNHLRDHIAQHLDTIDEQRRTLVSLMEQLHEGVVLTDANNRILLVNNAAIHLLGLAQPLQNNTLEGTSVEAAIPQHDLQRMLMSDIRRRTRHLDATVAGRWRDAAKVSQSSSDAEPIADGLVETKIQVDGRDGTIHLLARACDIELPEIDRTGGGAAAEGERWGRLLVLTDITTLAQTIQMKADFAANASHELRTPLSTIRAAVEVLNELNLATDEETARQCIAKIDRQQDRMERMVADLLDLSRIELSAARFEPQPLITRDLLAGLRNTFNDRLEAGKLEWVEEIGEACHEVTANADLMNMVLQNLVENAIRFTAPGGRISIRVEPRGERVAIGVDDTGCGIPQTDQNRVFQRFYQVEQARSGSDRGTGLGLSIVRHAVSAMRGTVHLDSEVGVGTRVTIMLPNV